jgi:hypothetical protein
VSEPGAPARFLPPWDVLDLRELPGGRYRLLRPLWYQSAVLGGRVVRVREGFLFDKESVPWWLPILYVWLAVRGKASRAGAVHDWLTAVHRVEDLPVTRALADRVYREAARVDGNGALTSWVKWLGVRLGGAESWRTGPARFRRFGNDRRTGQGPTPAVERRREMEAP